jgi:hypothetical protein
MDVLRIMITENAFSSDPNLQEVTLNILHKDLKRFIEIAQVNGMDIVILSMQEG